MFDSQFAFTILIFIATPIAIIVNIIKKKKISHHMVTLAIIINLALIIAVTLFPIPINSLLIARNKSMGMNVSYNLIPFRSIIGSLRTSYYMVGLRNILGNILLLLPLGFFIGMSKKSNKILNIIVKGFFISIAIEGIQLLLDITYLYSTPRTIDIDDIILNSTGYIIGYFIFRTIYNLWKHLKNNSLVS